MDHTSFQDLDIWGPDSFRASLLKKLDFTVTSGGLLALRSRMRHPFTDAGPIAATQGTLRLLSPLYAWWAAQFSERQLRYVEKYISSRITPFAYHNPWRAQLQAASFRRKYKQDWYFLHTAILHFCSLLQKLQALFAQFPEIPVPLQHLQQLLQALQDPGGIVAHLDPKKDRTYSTPRIVFLDSFFRRHHKSDCRELVDAFFDLDALFSMAYAQEKWAFQAPEISTTETRIAFEGLYHPLLPAATANDFCFQKGEHLLFLTGPNMAGKSTFLKAVGLAVYLAHLGMGVPAAAARMPVFDAIFVNINISDDIAGGNSYFQSEINRINEMAVVLQHSERALVIVDELFRGTNMEDAVDCAALVIEKLKAWPASCFLVSSHFKVLADRLAGTSAIRFMRFPATIVGDQPVFTYRLEEGVSAVRLGKTLLLNAGTLSKLQAVTTINTSGESP